MAALLIGCPTTYFLVPVHSKFTLKLLSTVFSVFYKVFYKINQFITIWHALITVSIARKVWPRKSSFNPLTRPVRPLYYSYCYYYYYDTFKTRLKSARRRIAGALQSLKRWVDDNHWMPCQENVVCARRISSNPQWLAFVSKVKEPETEIFNWWWSWSLPKCVSTKAVNMLKNIYELVCLFLV